MNLVRTALLLLPLMLWGQSQVYSPIPPTMFPGLDANLNSKPSITRGTGAPAGNCTAAKDLYISTAGAFYICVSTNSWSLPIPNNTDLSAFEASLAGVGGSGLVGFEASGTGAVLRSVESKLREVMSVTDSGADPTGISDSLTAFNSSYTATGNILIPAGTFSLSGPFNIRTSNTRVHCIGPSAIIQYTGTSAIDAVIEIGTYTGGYSTNVFNVTFDGGCTVKGNVHSAYVIHASNMVSSHLADMNMKDATTACLKVDYGNTLKLDNPICSQYINGVFSVVPTTAGAWFDHMNNVDIFVPHMEDLPSAAGFKFTSMAVAKIHGGTSEGNSYAMTADAASASIELDHMDNEANSIAGVSSAATGTIINGGIYSGTPSPANDINFLSGCVFCQVINEAAVNGVTVSAGAAYVKLDHFLFDENGGTVTDNGTCTKIEKLRDQNGGAIFPDKDACANILTQSLGNGGASALSINAATTVYKPANTIPFASETGANNALVAPLLDAVTGSAVPLVNGLRFSLQTNHTLQIGANTLNINAIGVFRIYSHRSFGADITAGYAARNTLDLMYENGTFLDMSQ